MGHIWGIFFFFIACITDEKQHTIRFFLSATLSVKTTNDELLRFVMNLSCMHASSAVPVPFTLNHAHQQPLTPCNPLPHAVVLATVINSPSCLKKGIQPSES